MAIVQVSNTEDGIMVLKAADIFAFFSQLEDFPNTFLKSKY